VYVSIMGLVGEAPGLVWSGLVWSGRVGGKQQWASSRKVNVEGDGIQMGRRREKRQDLINFTFSPLGVGTHLS
jgi:hypothetical protein